MKWGKAQQSLKAKRKYVRKNKYFIHVVQKSWNLINCQYELIMLSSASFHAATAPLYPFGNYLPFMVFGHDFLLAQSLRAKDMIIYILSIAVSTYCCHTRYAQNWHVHHYIQIQSLRLYLECVCFFVFYPAAFSTLFL